MDSLDRAEQHLISKYQKMKLLWGIMDLNIIVELFEVTEAGEKVLKLAVLKGINQPTIIYNLKIDEIIE